VKKTPLAAFSNPRPSGIQAILLDPDDSLINVSLTDGADEVVLGTRQGMACRFKEGDVRAMGRPARGVRGIDLRKDDMVVDLAIIRPGMSLLTVCENGFGKRTLVDEYRLTRRGGKGVINIRVTERNGQVVALRAVTDEDALMFITAQGILLRTKVSELREIGRATQGVRLIRVDEDDHVVTVASVVSDKEEQDVNGDATATPAESVSREGTDEGAPTSKPDEASGPSEPGGTPANDAG
jgi:DNA gyrase subunit A